MKKNSLLLCLFISTIVLSSCKKDNEIPGSISVKLSATTYYKNGSEEIRFERSGTIEKSSYSQSVKEGAGKKYLVNLGATANAPNIPVFGLSFLFNQQPSVEGITGTYNFPQDQLLIKATLRNEVTPTVKETIFYPTRGKALFSYDRNSGKLSGTIENLEFSIVPNDPFGRYRITVNGSFNNVPVK
jgi:hypothetical protein